MNSKSLIESPSPFVSALIPFIDANDGVALWGHHSVRVAACHAMAHFCNLRESQAVDWRLVVVSGAYRMAKRDFGEIIPHINFEIDRRGLGLHGRHGFAYVAIADWVRLQGHMSDNLMWLVDELSDSECWDAILSSVVPGVKIVAINPPAGMLDVLKSFLPKEHSA